MPRKRKCRYCGGWYVAHVRLKQRQVTCGKEECKRTHKKFLNDKRKAKALRRENARDWKITNKFRVKKNNHKYYQKNKNKYWRRGC